MAAGGNGVPRRIAVSPLIPRNGTEGSRRLIQAAAEKGAQATHERGLTDLERKERSRQSLRLNTARTAPGTLLAQPAARNFNRGIRVSICGTSSMTASKRTFCFGIG
jgi:hypothetical protein